MATDATAIELHRFSPSNVKEALVRVSAKVVHLTRGGTLDDREKSAFDLVKVVFCRLVEISEVRGKGVHRLSAEGERCLWLYETALTVARGIEGLSTPSDSGTRFFESCYERMCELTEERTENLTGRHARYVRALRLQEFLVTLSIRVTTEWYAGTYREYS